LPRETELFDHDKVNRYAKRFHVHLLNLWTEGHPDKLCDQISDAILDRFLQQDPYSALIAECAVSTGIVFIAARFASEATVDIPNVRGQVITQVGYDQPTFNPKTCASSRV